MLEFKQNTARFAPVRLFNAAGDPITGMAYTGVTAYVQKADGTTASFAVGASDWVEATAGSFAGTGVYAVRIAAGVLDQTGMLNYAIAAVGCVTYVGAVKVVANEEVDTYTTVERLQVIAEGRWKIHTSGGDANRLVLYAADGVTPIQRWDLKDKNGNATAGPDVMERVPVDAIP